MRRTILRVVPRKPALRSLEPVLVALIRDMLRRQTHVIIIVMVRSGPSNVAVVVAAELSDLFFGIRLVSSGFA